MNKQSGDTPEFSAFYAAYPRQEAKPFARRAWAAALNKGHKIHDIMWGLRNYAFSPDRQYVPMPATWLNQERWNDVRARAEVALPPQSRGRTSWMDKYDGGQMAAFQGIAPVCSTGPTIDGEIIETGPTTIRQLGQRGQGDFGL